METNRTNFSLKVNSKIEAKLIKTQKRSYTYHYNKALTQRENLIIWLRETQERSYNFIATIIDMTPEGARQAYFDAKDKLRVKSYRISK